VGRIGSGSTVSASFQNNHAVFSPTTARVEVTTQGVCSGMGRWGFHLLPSTDTFCHDVIICHLTATHNADPVILLDVNRLVEERTNLTSRDNAGLSSLNRGTVKQARFRGKDASGFTCTSEVDSCWRQLTQRNKDICRR